MSGQEARSAATVQLGWVCAWDGTTAPYLGDEHAVACPKCGRKMVPRV